MQFPIQGKILMNSFLCNVIFTSFKKQIFSSGTANIFLQLIGPANCIILEALGRAYQSTLKVDIDKRLRIFSKLRLIKFELAFGQVVHIITD